MSIRLNELRIGSKVIVRECFGGGPAVTVVVTEKDSDIKNGLPGICYRDASGNGKWAYLSQVDRVVKF